MPGASRPRVLIAGGGVAALEAALALDAMAPGRAAVTLLAPNAEVELPPLSTLASFGVPVPPPARLPDVAAAARARVVPGVLAAVRPFDRVVVTGDGRTLPYDFLIVAVGARREPVLAGALTFTGPPDVEPMRALVERVEASAAAGVRTRLAVVVPPGPGWSPPAYELALLTSWHLRERGPREALEIAIVTSEDAPVEVYGPEISADVRADLERESIALHTGAVVRDWVWGALELVPSGTVAADRVVALPALRGPAIDGLPQDPLGFVRIDPDWRIAGLSREWAVGDAGSFPIKHGGLGAQQADAVASRLAAELGAPVPPLPFDAVMRGALAEGAVARLMRSRPTGGPHARAGASWLDEPEEADPKLSARFLTPVLERLSARAPVPA